MINDLSYLEAKKIVADYENQYMNKHSIIGLFSSLNECENEAILFTENKLKVAYGLLSEDYKVGFKEGIEHYLACKNGL